MKRHHTTTGMLVLAAIFAAGLLVNTSSAASAEKDDIAKLQQAVKVLRCRLDHLVRQQDSDPTLEGTTRGILPGAYDMLGLEPPEEATVLIGPDTGLSKWKRQGGGDAGWIFKDGVAQVKPGTGSIITKEPYEDFRLHLEFKIPEDAEGQHSGNSGVYIQQRYEVQILNSHGREAKAGDCGGLYRYKAPNVNAARPPGEWQSYDIVFREPEWDDEGNKVEDVHITVVHNGELIHYDVELPNKTGQGDPEAPDPRPLRLQDHGSPVQFRNVWIQKLDL